MLLVTGFLFLDGLARCLSIRFLKLYMHFCLIFSVVEPCQRKCILVQQFDEAVLLNLL